MNDVVTADKVTAYGDRAVEQGKRVAEVPQQKGKPKPPPAPKPPPVAPHVDAARKLWTQHFAATWKGVVLHDIGSAPSKAVQGSSFDAWTNSGTQIFVHSKANKSPAHLYVVLHHEAEHIRQFRQAGKPPATYTKMMEHEYDAYGKSAAETKASARPDVQALHPTMQTMWEKFGDKMDEADATIPDPNARDAEYKRWLVAEGMLPTHSAIGDLYK